MVDNAVAGSYPQESHGPCLKHGAAAAPAVAHVAVWVITTVQRAAAILDVSYRYRQVSFSASAQAAPDVVIHNAAACAVFRAGYCAGQAARTLSVLKADAAVACYVLDHIKAVQVFALVCVEWIVVATLITIYRFQKL